MKHQRAYFAEASTGSTNELNRALKEGWRVVHACNATPAIASGSEFATTSTPMVFVVLELEEGQ